MVDKKTNLQKAIENQPKTIGIIMPLSPMGESYSAEHWSGVLQCLSVRMCLAGETPKMVSSAGDVSFITRTIVNRLYKDDIVICDVSGLNPNVMFELGLRIAFEKPIIIIKDSKTSKIPFDIGHIEYLEYPYDLNKPEMDKFLVKLKAKVKSSFAASKSKESQTILEQFGLLTNKKLQTESDVSKAIRSISNSVADMQERLSKQDYLLNRINIKVNPGDPDYFISYEDMNPLVKYFKNFNYDVKDFPNSLLIQNSVLPSGSVCTAEKVPEGELR